VPLAYNNDIGTKLLSPKFANDSTLCPPICALTSLFCDNESQFYNTFFSDMTITIYTVHQEDVSISKSISV